MAKFIDVPQEEEKNIGINVDFIITVSDMGESGSIIWIDTLEEAKPIATSLPYNSVMARIKNA